MSTEADKIAADEAAAAVAKQGGGVADLSEGQNGPGNQAPQDDTQKPADRAEADAAEAADKAAEDAKAAEDKAKNAPLDTGVWGDLGDETGNSVLQLLQNSGITPDEAKALLFDAASSGDITRVDKEKLAEKVGAASANLILVGMKDFLSTSKAKADAIVADVHTAVGGKDNWDAVTAWAKANVSDAELGEYRKMIDAGGAQARFAATELAAKFNGDSKNTTLDTSGEIIGDGAAQSVGRALTKTEYVKELQKAYDSSATEVTINEIKAARARGRAKGI